MNIVNLLNPTPSAGNTGGPSGGGPSNTQIAVPQHQGDNNPDQDNPNPINPVVNDLTNNARLADRLRARTDEILESRRQAIENTPNIHNGRRARITEIVTLNDIGITRDERSRLRNLVARDDWPARFSTFKNYMGNSANTVYSKNLRYDLINYIRSRED